MSKNRIIKLAVFNLGLCLVNILLFSNAFLRLDISGKNAITTALGIMVIVMSVILFGYVNYRLLNPPPTPPLPPLTSAQLSTLDDCAGALERYIERPADTFDADLRTVVDQITRLKKKKRTIRDMLLERFSDTELSYGKFDAAVSGVENIMLLNVRSLLHRVNAFDEDEYERALRKGMENSRLAETRRAILREYTSYVSRAADDNEEILLRLDKLILEITKLGDISDGVVEDLPAMREIDALIGDTKWYK